MTEKINATLRDSKAARWSALLIVSFTMLCGYFFTDVMSPLKGLLEGQIGWTSSDYGQFTSSYGWFNVFLLMLILGGIILDKVGPRLTGLGSAGVMVVGTIIQYWAVSTHSLDGSSPIFGIKAQVLWASIGFAIFAVGVEVAGVTVTKIINKWFQGHELALAMGLQVALARIGTAFAIAFSGPIARSFGMVDISRPVLVGAIGLCIGLLAFVIYTFLDKKLDASLTEVEAENSEEEKFKLSDIGQILTNKGWWYVAILCVLFYSAVFPFLKYATDLMVNKFGVSENLAGVIPSLLPFGTIVLTPLFGGIYDKKGRGATIMIIGASLLVFVHLLFSLPIIDNWIIAIILTIILGIGFSLVPSAMWPSVTKIVPERQLGTAMSLIFWVQNWGLMGVPALIGYVLDKYCISGEIMRDGNMVNTYNYTLPMLMFAGFGLLAILFAFLLKAEDKKKGYGLERPNIK